VHPAALESRVYEGAEPDARQRAGLSRRDVAVEMRDHALGEVVRLDPVAEDQLPDLRRESEVAADDAVEETVVREEIEPLVLRVALAGGVNEGEAPRPARLPKALRESDEERLRHPVTAVAGRGEHGALGHAGLCDLAGDDLLE